MKLVFIPEFDMLNPEDGGCLVCADVSNSPSGSLTINPPNWNGFCPKVKLNTTAVYNFNFFFN